FQISRDVARREVKGWYPFRVRLVLVLIATITATVATPIQLPHGVDTQPNPFPDPFHGLAPAARLSNGKHHLTGKGHRQRDGVTHHPIPAGILPLVFQAPRVVVKP